MVCSWYGRQSDMRKASNYLSREYFCQLTLVCLSWLTLKLSAAADQPSQPADPGVSGSHWACQVQSAFCLFPVSSRLFVVDHGLWVWPDMTWKTHLWEASLGCGAPSGNAILLRNCEGVFYFLCVIGVNWPNMWHFGYNVMNGWKRILLS